MSAIETPMPAALLNVLRSMAHEPVRNYVLPGLTSMLIGGFGQGRVRLFAAARDSREWIVPHSHRFDFVCLVLRGKVTNVRFTVGGIDHANAYAIGRLKRSTGGFGEYDIVHGTEPTRFREEEATYAAGDFYAMRAPEIHSIRFGAGAEVLFFEGPDLQEETVFLEPWCDGGVVPTFAVQPWMFQRGEPLP